MPDEKKRPDRFSKMHDDLLEQLVGIGMIVASFNHDDGLVVLNRADPLATKIVAVARQNPGVYKALKRALEGSVYSVLALECGTIANAIMANHGFNPAEKVLALFKRKESDGNAHVSAVA